MMLKYDNFRFYWAVVTEKTFRVYTKIYDKSAFSPVIDIFEK